MSTSRKSIKDMSDAERRRYRQLKRLKRRIQVYTELGVIVLVILLIVGFSVKHFSKDDTETSVQVTKVVKEKEEKGLKITPKDTPPDEQDEVEPAEDETNKVSAYTFNKTESTGNIYSEAVVSPYGIIVNKNSGNIVAEKNSLDKIYPASMTKIMTVLTAANNISPENLNENVELSHEAVDFAFGHDCSTSGFSEGEVVTVKDLFYGTILPSGGDAAIQLAMYVSGDVETFVELMNQTCKDLGISDSTHFTNPVGVYDDNNYSTAYDMAIIMNAALDNEICNEVLTAHTYDSTHTAINPEGITISNWFLRRIEDREFGGTIGGAKTGYVVQSGSCAASSEVAESGTEYICVTAGSSSSWQCIADHVEIYKTYGK